MKFLLLLLSSFMFSSYSCAIIDEIPLDESFEAAKPAVCERRRISLNAIPMDVRRIIACYLWNPTIMGQINREYYGNFRRETSLKQSFDRFFLISGLEIVGENEPELAGLLKLTWASKNSVYLFSALLEDISSGKKPYKTLFRPLILHLDNIYKFLSQEQRNEYLDYLRNKVRASSFERHLANVCAINYHFDLVFVFLKNEPESIIHCLTGIENRQVLFKFFKENYHLALQLSESFSFSEIEAYLSNYTSYRYRYRHVFQWIAECIIYNLPEESYSEILKRRPLIFKYSIEYLLLSSNIPESEYSRIHAQLTKLFAVNYKDNFAMYLNDLRFISKNLLRSDFSYLAREYLSVIGKVALLANKMDTFLEIYKVNKGILNEIMKMKKSHIKTGNFKVIFELIASENVNFEFFDDHVDFIMEYYAIEHFRSEGDRFVFEFVAPENLLTLGFPPVILVNIKADDLLMEKIFFNMKVISEETVISLLSDYMNYLKFKREINVPIELVELCLNSQKQKSQKLLLFLKQNSFKFIISDMKRFFTLPNYEAVSDIVHVNIYSWRNLTLLKDEKSFRFIELVKNKSIADCYLLWENEQIMFQGGTCPIEYFEWRLALIYWMKGEHKERLKEIKFPNIIEILKLEFPEEMKQILN